MRALLRTFVFTYLSVYFLLLWFPFYSFENDKTFTLFIIMLTLLYHMNKYILNMLSLPTEGVGYVLINFLLTYIILLVFSVLFRAFTMNSLYGQSLKVGPVMVTSFNLAMPWSGVVSALILSRIYAFFIWLSYKKR